MKINNISQSIDIENENTIDTESYKTYNKYNKYNTSL